MHIRGACNLTLIEVTRKSSDMFVRENRNISRASQSHPALAETNVFKNVVQF